MCADPLDLEMKYIARVYLRGVAELAYKQAKDCYVEKLRAYMDALRREEEALQAFIRVYNIQNIRADVQIKKELE
jgi:hypothetical protein